MTSAGISRDVASAPGYRRAVRIEPGQGSVLALLEDDLHAMAVRLDHDGDKVLAVTAYMDRAPWSTCPGAEAVLAETFTGIRLRDVTATRNKPLNCTHLHDLAVLGAVHAHDDEPTQFDIRVSDPVSEPKSNGAERVLEIRRDGVLVHRWIERGGTLTVPQSLAGRSLLTLRDWIATLNGAVQEAARLLQWAGLVAHGRTMSDEAKRSALGHRPSCYTMQPARVSDAAGPAPMRDFNGGDEDPLADLGDRFAGQRSSGVLPADLLGTVPRNAIRMGESIWK